MKKRILSLLLGLSVLLSLVPAVSAYSGVSSWAQEAVSSMYDLGFLPESLKDADMSRPITRGEMCQMAVLVYNQLMGTPGIGPTASNYFSDTTDPAVSYAFEQGIVSGYGDGTFLPKNHLTREEFFKITYNVLTTAYWDPSSVELAPLSAFGDGERVQSWALVPTQAMVAIGVVQGDGKNLTPQSETSREEAVLMFFRAYHYMCDWMKSFAEGSMEDQIYSQGYSGISSWAVMEVSEMQELGMIPSCLDGCNMSLAITRAQMCAIALCAFNRLSGEAYAATGAQHFSDTDDEAVNAAFELGIVNGDGDGTFRPDSPLSREEFFQIMSNFMQVFSYSRKDAPSISLSFYADGGRVSSWARPATRLMIYIGAVRGDGKRLNPQSETSIEEAIAVFLRCYKYTVSWRETYPDGEEIAPELSIRDDITTFARSHEGCAYTYGGVGPDAFDCSGFVLYVYKHFGYSFSRGAQEQYRDGRALTMEQLRPGDLVFFSSYSDIDYSNFRNITHVGLYLGDGAFIHASNPTRGVVIDSLWSGYYYQHFFGGCCILDD